MSSNQHHIAVYDTKFALKVVMQVDDNNQVRIVCYIIVIPHSSLKKYTVQGISCYFFLAKIHPVTELNQEAHINRCVFYRSRPIL